MKRPRFELCSVEGHAGLKEWDEDEGTSEVLMTASYSHRLSTDTILLLQAVNTLAQELKETRAELAALKGLVVE